VPGSDEVGVVRVVAEAPQPFRLEPLAHELLRQFGERRHTHAPTYPFHTTQLLTSARGRVNGA